MLNRRPIGAIALKAASLVAVLAVTMGVAAAAEEAKQH